VAIIDVLPDDVLLAIFDFYVFKYQDISLLDVVFDDRETKRKIESWQSLVHVCRRWRGLIFESPRCLNLQLPVFCLPRTLARNSLDVWPALPLLIYGHLSETPVDDVIAELEHSDRICQINLEFNTTSQIEIEKLWTAMQVPFPELEILRLFFGDVSNVPVLPDRFLGGSASRLRFLRLNSIPIRGLPNLLMSATHLVHLCLYKIPHSGYIAPNAVATCLSRLTNMERLQLEFESPQSSPGQESRGSPPLTRSILPALTEFSFKGVNEYFEELVARIDTPRLEIFSATFFNDIEFETPELIRFLSRSSTFNAPKEAHLFFDNQAASLKLLPRASNIPFLLMKILCREQDWQLSSLAQICTTSLHLLSATENLFIYEPVKSQLDWKDGIENIEWLELLLPFTAVKNLYLSKQFAPRIAPALQEITEDGATEVLSTVQNLYLEGFEQSQAVPEVVERFISGRQLTNRPVVISAWDRYSTWDRLEGYYRW
jgi:hypothetical protein